MDYREPTAKQIAEQKLYRDLGLSDAEYGLIQEYLGRLPNYTEVGLYSVMWSEHCSYKHSKPLLKRFPVKADHVLQGPGEGAGIVDIGDGYGVCFKIESHNHPSAVEPYQGAATGVGGILRDIYSMGAKPIAILDSLRYGDLSNPKVRELFKGAIAGMADYGNGVDVPTVGGEIYFDSSYTHNPLVNAMCVGVVRHEDIQRGVAYGEGNVVLYVGADTGRDGIHGATFASAELSADAEEKRSSVPIGNPQIGKQLMDACLEMIKLPSLIGIQDMGAAGLISSSSEMAAKGQSGIELNLDLVPQREEGMTAYEMMLSESQERMLLVVEKGHEAEFIAVGEKYGIHCVPIGHVTSDGRLRLWHHGELVADVPVDSLATKAPVNHVPSRQPEVFEINQKLVVTDITIEDPQATLQQLLSTPTLASKEWVYQQFNQNNTVLVGAGSDAAVVKLEDTDKALTMTTDCNADYIYLDPKMGSAIAVAEAARNIVCSGGKPLAITDNLNFGSPENPEVFWQLEQAVDGISEACRMFNLPVISGNVSLYNETNKEPILPTPIIGMVGLIENTAYVTTHSFKQAGDVIVLLGKTKAELGGTQLQKLIEGQIRGRIPQLDLKYEQQLQQAVTQAIRQGLIQSAHDVADGGLAVALAECAFGTGLGLAIDMSADLPLSAILFGESQSRVILSVKPEHLSALTQLVNDLAVDMQIIGTVTAVPDYKFAYNELMVIDCPLASLEKAWKDGIPCLMQS